MQIVSILAALLLTIAFYMAVRRCRKERSLCEMQYEKVGETVSQETVYEIGRAHV